MKKAKDILIFDTPMYCYAVLTISKDIVRKNFLAVLNNNGFVAMDVRVYKIKSSIRIESIWKATAICAKTTVEEAKKIKEIKKRPDRPFIATFYGSRSNQKKQTKGGRVGKGKGKATRARKTRG